MVVLLCSNIAFARSIRGLKYQQELISYTVRTFSVSVTASQPANPAKLSSCVENAISGLIQTWEYATYPNETLVASSPPSFCNNGANWTSPTNWTAPTSFPSLKNWTWPSHRQRRTTVVVIKKCNYACFTQAIVSCHLCSAARRMQQTTSRSLSSSTTNGDVYAGLEQGIKSQLPKMCPEIQNITSVNVTLDGNVSATSSNVFANNSNWVPMVHGW